MEEVKSRTIENLFQDLFSATGTGEEELLRIASTYSRQITGRQMRILLFLEFLAFYLPENSQNSINNFVNRWLELKQFNNSDAFVMKALEYISLRKFLGENAIKVNVEK